MDTTNSDVVFAGSIPQLYEALLVPLIFEPYARDMASRVADLLPRDVLEVAAGTGALSRALALALPGGAHLVATDLNTGMLDHAAALPTARPVEWRQADAMDLPFAAASFDAVVCQFGAMFFPDVRQGFREARRVLRPGGALLFSVWDRVEENEFAATVTEALADVFPSDPPRFLARTPHGYHEPEAIAADLAAAGFSKSPRLVTLAARSRASSPKEPAAAYCEGTPLRTELEARSGPGLDEATRICAEAIAGRFGTGPVDGKIQAHVIAIRE
jgi:SAM-dependent methyltransferase